MLFKIGCRDVPVRPAFSQPTIALSGWFISARSDADETSQTQQSNFPKTEVFAHIEVVDGRIWLRPEEPLGSRSRAGTSSAKTTALCIPIWSAPRPSA
jgi:isocitrate lyase